MKRTVLPALIIGALVSGVLLALHSSGLAVRLELATTEFFSHYRTATRLVGDKWQYPLVFAISVGVIWLTLRTTQRRRLAWLVGLLALELVALSWICSLYHLFFQPLPAVFAALLSFPAALGYRALARRFRAGKPATVFAGRLSRERLQELDPSDVPQPGSAKTYDATVVVCDIGHKHDVAEDAGPVGYAKIVEEFITHAKAQFLEAGAFIETANGEGIVAFFGFPCTDEKQAERATQAALDLVRSVAELRNDQPESAFRNCDVHIGVSSGAIVGGRLRDIAKSDLFATGEPVELARRFCIANRFYGSRILIGPRTFELASKAVVARPIDFLSGVDIRERHEVYEPLALALQASAEEVKRRDSFWNGVVLYREKRWGEAYSQFQKAVGPNGQEDAPLQLYLRRLESLALNLTSDPAAK